MTPVSRQRRLLPLVAIAAAALITGFFAIPAYADDPMKPEPCPTENIADDQLADIADCDPTGLTIRTRSGATMGVPEKGVSVVASWIRDDGIVDHPVTVFQSEEGGVAISEGSSVYAGSTQEARSSLNARHQRNAEESQPSAPLAVSKCSSAAPYVRFSKWGNGGEYKWYYNSAGQPDTFARTRISSAGATIAGGLSSTCGNLSNGSTTPYGGTTTGAINVNSNGCPDNYSGFNAQGWGALTGPQEKWLALNCTWYTVYIRHSDTKFDLTGRSWWTGATTSGCSGKWDLQGVATHEFGHALGLDHVHESEPQVMNPGLAGTCNWSWRQLGRGDQNGLRAQYGS
ncbi:matrixin family metalloprotease [Microlunatus speluncae]|uniref:matrixin family metalloprotease n=1 Tax=Microlunatus speluncae TaxID=2594267 RepID=UPI00126610D4|nr:matrixin family metalloprotease [Microlunatus speluncae]